MTTRLLPARLVSPRLLPPRYIGGSSAPAGQVATHLGVQVQPGGGVSGLPLSIQPVIAALDNAEAVVTSFGGTISAAVSSGPGIVTAGANVTASTGLGAYSGLTLALTGAPGLVTVTFSSGALTITSATFFLSAAGAVVLVESPTRLGTMRRFAKTGDTVVITDTLMGVNRDPQDLPSGSSAVLTLKTEDGTVLVNRQPVTILQTGAGDTATAKGGVTITLPPSTNIPAGTSSFEIEATTPTGDILTFPDDSNAELVVIPQLG